MELLERLGTDFTMREASAFPERSLGSSSKRATEAPELDRRYMDADDRRDMRLLGGALVVSTLGAIGGGIYGLVKQHENKQQRDLS